VQSALATAKLRRAIVRSRAPCSAPRELIVECSEGVRLLALHDPATAGGHPKRGVAVLLHGWEGSARSTYLESLRPALLADGFEVYRLNFRDHGPTHQFNPGLFHSCRLTEVVDAIVNIAERARGVPVSLVGYSLGGNFALRVGLHAPARGVRLSRIVAVNPVLEPEHVLRKLESGPAFFERYFVRKWRKSIRTKQRTFPGLYDFDDWMRIDRLREQTRDLVERYTEFGSLDAYLDGYCIGRDRLAGLQVPSSLITSHDDPIVPVDDLAALEVPDCLRVEVQRWGGHCGYVENLRLTSWIDRRVRQELNEEE
jgi:predicted alpha/beta-fold hydrolase